MPARLEHTIVPIEPGFAETRITSGGFNYPTRVEAPAPGVSFDTNYLDLRDGDSAVISVAGLPSGFDAVRLWVLSRSAKSPWRQCVR